MILALCWIFQLAWSGEPPGPPLSALGHYPQSVVMFSHDHHVSSGVFLTRHLPPGQSFERQQLGWYLQLPAHSDVPQRLHLSLRVLSAYPKGSCYRLPAPSYSIGIGKGHIPAQSSW